MHFKSENKNFAFDDYWLFAFRRQEIFINNAYKPTVTLPFSDDILDTYKFTNCYRCTDRVSQYLIKEVIYKGNYNAEDTFLRIILFKLFNKIDTWKYLEEKLGDINLKNFNIKHIGELLSGLFDNKRTIYSAAYIMPSGKKEFGHQRKHLNNLALIQRMLDMNLQSKVWLVKDLSSLYALFLSLPTLGPFLAYQFSIDISYSDFSLTDESQFVIAGPGAIRGIKKCFKDTKGYSNSDIIKFMVDAQEQEFHRLELDFKYLGNRSLQLIDCQNIFCEVDKYCRVKYPEKVVGNTRIKQKYRPNSQEIDYVFPHHWNASLPI